ncbi:MAG: hypothetical protein OXN93_11150 [bacterium]|nr:hypothetical protein [bacterium]
MKALLRADNKASLQDLVAELRRGGSTDAVQDTPESLFDSHGEMSERLASDAFSEIEDRAEAAGVGYPFTVGTRHIELAPHVDIKESTYIFQLLLSNFGVNAGKTSRVRPERDFEDISLDAAESYLGRNNHDGSYLFAFPRRTDDKNFPAAVDKLSERLGEGGGANSVGPAKDQKDAFLDIVVWHGFADRRPGQMIAFGQCAAGGNWRRKVTELPSGDVWCRAWMFDPPAVPPIRMLFIPHRLTEEEWKTRSILAGVVFERCRIAYHSPVVPKHVAKRCGRWVTAALNTNVLP